MLWGDNVHVFYAFIGILVGIMGILLALGVFKQSTSHTNHIAYARTCILVTPTIFQKSSLTFVLF